MIFSTNPPTSFLISEMRRMLKANIMGNAFDLSDKLIVQCQNASNFFGRVNTSSLNVTPAEGKHPVTPKVT